MCDIKKASNSIISKIEGAKREYMIFGNGDVMEIISDRLWSRVNEVKDSSGNECVKLLVDIDRSEYFKKSDLLSGIINPIDHHEMKKRKNEKRVEMYKDGVLVKIFYNANVASKETGISQSGIYNCCNNARYCKTAGGFEWKYEQ